MSSADSSIEVVGEAEARMLHCASCGIAGLDDIKLTECNGCDLVRYCSDECQQLHRPEHEEECKKRVAEIRDELLFKQPESSHRGDCPICTLPLYGANFVLTSCCFKSICQGCSFGVNRNTCPFCREPVPKTEEDRDKLRMKRIEANDPVALRQEGGVQNKKGEYRSAFEYYTKAAELGEPCLDCSFRSKELRSRFILVVFRIVYTNVLIPTYTQQ